MTAVKQRYHHGDLRTALLDSALEIIGELGPHGLTIREVARRAGVSHAAPYRHFKDKNELILAVVERGFELMNATMQAKKEAAGDDLLNQFAASGLAYVDFALNHPAYYRIMFSGDLLSTTGNVSLQHTSREALQQMVSDIGEDQKMGFVKEGDPVTQALTILSTLHGFVSLANDNRIGHLVDNPYSLDDIRDAVLSAIFDGIGAAPPSTPS
mgnify:CR=1 FL=1